MLLAPRHRRLAAALLVLVSAGALAGCGDGGGGKASRGKPEGTTGRSAGATTSRDPRSVPPKLRLALVGKFESPVLAIAVPGTDLVAVVEKTGRLRFASGMVCASADTCPSDPVDTGRVVIDLTEEVSTSSEQGLLGVAFHPDWPRDPRIFIDYTDVDGNTRVEAWTLDGPSGKARRERELLRVDQPFENHNGGNVAFGPDGLLYVGMGDGGSAGDPGDRAQSPEERLGKLLRLDVDHGGERGFAVPKGNLAGGAPEVWALGLRNPWRFSFDSRTGDLWIGDVGQDTKEEVDAVTRASLASGRTPNFGWRRREGFDPFDDSGRVGPGTIVEPVLDYGRKSGCSITGGVVYRGKLVPALDGWYVFADFCGDDLRLLRAEGVPGSRRREGELRSASVPGATGIASFGVAQRGELLVVSQDGSIRQVLPA